MSRSAKARGAFASVLCPIDFSRHSRAALRYAAAVAQRSGGSLTVLFVADPLLVSAAAAAYGGTKLAKQSRDELDRFVRRTLGARGETAVTCEVATGEPARLIQRYAKSRAADLIVLGSEGLGGANKLFFGSTTARVLGGTGVPVLAVPPAARTGSAVPAGWPRTRMVAAIDLGRHASGDVATAAALARWFACPLSLVHVVTRTRLPDWLALRPVHYDRERCRQARTRLEKLAVGVGPGPEGFVDAHVLVGEAAEQIASLAGNLQADLIVVTLRGNGFLFGDRKGTTTYRIVQEAGKPILAVPDGWRWNAS